MRQNDKAASLQEEIRALHRIKHAVRKTQQMYAVITSQTKKPASPALIEIWFKGRNFGKWPE